MNLVQGYTTQETAADPSARKIELIPSPKWVRVSFGGEFIADSKNVILLRQKGRSPVYYFPQRDVRLEFLEETGRIGKLPNLGKANLLTVRVGSRVAENAAWLIAETDHPVLLFETGLPPRYDIPKADVRSDLLESSDTHTTCPYKGVASYYSAKLDDRTIKDLVWYYPAPYDEGLGKIQDLVAFYPEKVDAIYLDGVKQA